jgi:Right handed beta helix region
VRPTPLILGLLMASTCVGAATAAPPVIALSTLDGATTPAEFVLDVDIAGATSARLVVDGDYVGRREGSPVQFSLSLTAGPHRLRIRAEVAGSEVRVEARFTVAGDATLPSQAPASDSLPAASAPAIDGEIVVDTVDEIGAALNSAQPGDVVHVADGEYLFDERLVASASGTEVAPITLRGSRAAMIRTEDESDDYGLHVTGDHWRIEGITIAYASKGIVLDGSIGTVIDSVEVYEIGDEGVHFRTCSSDGVLRNSFVHDTGRDSPQYGEGVYVGSANSNWSDHECADPIEGVGEGDNTERVLIEGNVFEDITAEGADLKEGTDSGTVRGNVFRRVGASGENSADSAIDAKGNNWLIEDNEVTETDAPWSDEGEPRPSAFADGYQTHSVYDGYGTGNVFRNNRVTGAIPGFGIGLYPALDNVVTCDNTAPEAAEGLVGDNGQPADCEPV